MEKHRCGEIERDLFAFKEQYARNGKELVRLAMSIEAVTKEVRDHHVFSERNKLEREAKEKEFRKELEPVLRSYNTLLTGRKWVIGTTAFFLSVGSLYLLIRQIFHK